jgi:AcrR family transcriptional regulator
MTDPYHHGDLQNALLEASVSLIEEHGVAGLSLREAARRVGVSHAAPYRHFADKNALLIALAEQGFSWLIASAEAAMAAAPDATAALLAYGRQYVRFALRHPVHFRVMFTGAFPKGDLMLPAGVRAYQLLFEAAERASPGVDAHAVALSSWSAAHGLANLLLDGRVPPPLVADEAGVEAVINAVLARVDLR